MIAQRFLICGWTLQLLTGCTLFVISLYFEARVLSAFFQHAGVAWSLAIALEMGKALAIIWYRLGTRIYPAAFLLKLVSTCFRIGLILLSVLCTLLFLANYLDRPTLEQAASADQSALAERHKRESDLRQSRAKLERQRLTDIHRKKVKDIDNLYKPGIEAIRSNLRLEMDNVVHGEFIGPRYREFERLLALELDRHKKAIEDTTAEFDRQQLQLSKDASVRQQRLEDQQKKEHLDLLQRNYSLDERANDPHIIAFIHLLAEVFTATVKPLQFIFFFSILLSLLIELGIWLAFDTITSFAMPELILQRQHQYSVAQQRSDAAGKTAANTEFEKQSMDSVVRKARQTIARALRAKDRFDTAA